MESPYLEVHEFAAKAYNACLINEHEQNITKAIEFWKSEIEENILGFPMAEKFWRIQAFDLTEMVNGHTFCNCFLILISNFFYSLPTSSKFWVIARC